MGDAADGLEAYPSAAASRRQALATVVDSRAKFNVTPNPMGGDDDGAAGGKEDAASRKVHRNDRRWKQSMERAQRVQRVHYYTL